MIMSLIAQKAKLEREIEKTIEEFVEKYGEVPEEYLDDIVLFYETRELWDKFIQEEWEKDLEE
jgi:hypothetical protein